jgi:ribosome-binding factor A
MAIKTIPRTRRVGEQIRRELAELIRAELRDPRLALVSMTSVEVSRDLAYARIYVTLMGDPAERAERVAELNRAAPLLRRELGRRMRLRIVPKLEFRYDEVVEQRRSVVGADRCRGGRRRRPPPRRADAAWTPRNMRVTGRRPRRPVMRRAAAGQAGRLDLQRCVAGGQAVVSGG